MKSNFQRIVKSYKKAQKEYNKDFKSDHWERGYKKRNDLFKFKNLKNFRNNSLSFGLDTRTGSLKNQKLLYEEIKRKHAILSANKIDFKANSKNGLEIRLNDDVIGIILSYL